MQKIDVTYLFGFPFLTMAPFANCASLISLIASCRLLSDSDADSTCIEERGGTILHIKRDSFCGMNGFRKRNPRRMNSNFLMDPCSEESSLETDCGASSSTRLDSRWIRKAPDAPTRHPAPNAAIRGHLERPSCEAQSMPPEGRPGTNKISTFFGHETTTTKSAYLTTARRAYASRVWKTCRLMDGCCPV